MEEEQKPKWWKNKYNLIFLAILAVAFIIRLYLFILTKNQTLWWDGSEYLLRAKGMAFGTPVSGWNPSRELIFPFLISLVLRIGFGEITIRFLQILISTSIVLMVYLVAKEMFNKKLALISSFLISFLWVELFFAQRILLYIWPCLIYLIVILFFWKGYVKKERKLYLYLFAISASIGLQIYFSTAFLLLGILLFVIITERTSLFKNKNVWISILLFFIVLAPYMIYSQITFGFPIPRIAQGAGVLTEQTGKGIKGFFDYTFMLPSRIGWIATIFAGLGIVFFIFQFILRAGIIFKERNHNFDNWILIFLCFSIPFIIYSYIAAVSYQGAYDAFILGTLPLLVILASNPILNVYHLIKKHTKIIAILFIIITLGFHFYFNVTTGHRLIMAKEPSFKQLKEVSLWLKLNTPKDAIIYTTSMPQVTYYGERESIRIPDTEEEFETINLSEHSYYLISVFERTHHQWLFEYPSEKNLTVLMVSFLDDAKQHPGAIVYKLK